MFSPVIDRLLQSIDIEKNLLPYLRFSGWKDASGENINWIVFHGENDFFGKPIELVFPKKERSIDEKREYIIKAVELLTAIKDEPLQLVVQSIICYDRDLLFIRNTETGNSNAIPLALAVNQVNNLKKTLEFSASSEKDAKPYFYYVNSKARQVIKEFLFGHTFAGSFGFTVEAPRLPDPPKFIQTRFPFVEDDAPISDIPIERRIVERIARGLSNIKQAEETRDHTILLSEYASGFNSNMCSAIVDMSRGKRETIEFRVVWSPKIKPGEDIENLMPVRVRENGYEILEYVANELKTKKPLFLTLTGHIRALTASDNPLNSSTRRAVVLRALLPNARRENDIILELERDDYSKANIAHMNWQIVQVSGVLSRSGTGYRLL